MKIHTVLLVLLLLGAGAGLALLATAVLVPLPAAPVLDLAVGGSAPRDSSGDGEAMRQVLERLTAIERDLAELHERVDTDRLAAPEVTTADETAAGADPTSVVARLAELERHAAVIDTRVEQVETQRPLSVAAEQDLLGMLGDADAMVRARALHELRRRRSDSAVEAAIRLADDPDDLVRESVADYFEDVPDARGHEALVKLAGDANNEVADAAVDAIATRRDAAAVAALENLYQTAKDPRVAYAAGRNRLQLGRDDQELAPFHPPLDRWRALLSDASPRNRETAVYALRAFGGEDDINTLQTLRHDEDQSVRRAVVRTLREWGVAVE